jgi:Eukaryotic aspartyl protease
VNPENALFGLYCENGVWENGPTGGEITFGSTNTARFTGSLVEIPNISTEGIWAAAVVNFRRAHSG